MAKMIRCIEGHVFEIGNGQCPVCGWKVPPERSFGERLAASIPTPAQIRKAVLDPIARVSDHDVAQVAVGLEKSPIQFPPLLIRLIRSRTVLLLALAVGLIALTAAPPLGTIPTILWVFCIFICLLLVVGVQSVMRSKAPLTLLFYSMIAEILLLELPIWSFGGHARSTFFYWYSFWNGLLSYAPWIASDSPVTIDRFLYFLIGAGLNEDTFKILPVAFLLLLFWAIKAAPAIPQPVKSKIVSWSKLDRATTVIALAFASAAAFVLEETLGLYIGTAIERSANETNALLKTILTLFPAGNEVRLGPAGQITRAGWENLANLLSIEVGLWKGVALAIPRTLGLLTGHGAFAGVAAYYLALARGKYLPIAIFLVVFGFLLSAALHGSWDALAGDFWNVPLAVLSGVILWAVCVQAVALDRRSGFVDQPLPLGRSLTVGGRIPDFPAGQIHEAAVQPGQIAPSQAVPRATTPEPSPPPLAPLAGTLIIEGTASSPGRRLHLRRGGGRVELAPDVVLEVTAHHADPKRLGLKNIGSGTWKLTMPDGRKADVATGKNAALADQATIDFGGLVGRIEAAQTQT